MIKTIKILSIFVCFTICANCSSDDSSAKEEVVITDENGDEQTVDISLNKRQVGDSANDMMSGTNFDAIRFEIFYIEGLKPTENTISNFETFLSERLNKPNGIVVQLTQIASPGQAVYTINEIRDLEDDIRTKYNDEKEVAVFGIFIDGEYSENTENGSVLGVAYRNTSFVVFEETVQRFSGQPLAPSTTVLETTVLNHEFGHLLGLVNAGTTPQTDHQDVEHGRHCTTEDCLMFWTAETGEGLLNSISGGVIPSLDPLCIQDLQANGGK
jgi:hypothetical protein